MNQQRGGLHPESQRLLWSLVYDVRTDPFLQDAWRQLEQRGLITRTETGYGTLTQWEVTPLGVAQLQAYAPFLKRKGMNCPPGN